MNYAKYFLLSLCLIGVAIAQQEITIDLDNLSPREVAEVMAAKKSADEAAEKVAEAKKLLEATTPEKMDEWLSLIHI